MRILTTAMLLSLGLPLRGERALAQQTETQLAVSAGVATDQRGVRSSAIAVAPTLALQASPNVALQVGANATRFATQAWSVGAQATLFARNALTRFLAVTMTASGSVSRLAPGRSGTFMIGDVIPALEAIVGPLTLYGGARAAAGRATQPGIPAGPPIIGGAREVAGVVTTASRLAPLYGAALRFTGDVGSVQLSARTEPDDGTSASLSASLPVTRDIDFDFGAGRYPVNRLLNTPAGSYASAGFSLRLGGATRRPSPLPSPIGVRAPRAGMTRLAIRASDARQVEVAGDFTNWKFVAATRAENGVWYADLQVPPGQYRYAFRINGSEWRVPDGATAVDDGFGGKSAWITVPDRRVGR